MNNKVVTLYHGSKSGIKGAIAPVSRDKCDFGKGFYMGTERLQPLTLICNYPEAKLYTLKLDLNVLNVLEVEVGLEWALLVAYNRGKMEVVKGSKIYERFANMTSSYDVIVGYIANDRMFVVLDRFFKGEITDIALINSLSALKLGKQYVAITPKACEQLKVVGVEELTVSDREQLKFISESNRKEGISLAEEVCKKHRREGRYFDEILEAGE